MVEAIKHIISVFADTRMRDYRLRIGFNWLWLILILLVAYVSWMHILPFGGTINYLMNIGDEESSINRGIIVPSHGMSSSNFSDTSVYRQVEISTLEFPLADTRLQNANKVTATVRFRGNLPPSSKLSMELINKTDGNQHSEIRNKDLYIPFFEKIADLNKVLSDGKIDVYSVSGAVPSSINNVEEFLEDPPVGSTIGVNDDSIAINQNINPKYIKLQTSDFGDSEPGVLNFESDSKPNSLQLNHSLREGHTFYIYISDGNLNLKIEKIDLNNYEGEDNLEVSLFSLDGVLLRQLIIPDDGDSTGSKIKGIRQQETINLFDVEKGVYRLTVNPNSEKNDLVISNIVTDKERLVAFNRVFIAGNIYFQKEPEPVVLWCYLVQDSEISFRTPHSVALQDITLSTDNYSQKISLNEPNKVYSTGLLKEGIYKITSPKGDVIINSSSSYFSFQKESLFVPISGQNYEAGGSLHINVDLRGRHTFWTYVDNGTLSVKISKRDLNSYNGEDEATLSIYTASNQLILSEVIPDDDNTKNTQMLGNPQTVSIHVDQLAPGPYMLDFMANNDTLLDYLEINQSKLVLEDRVFLIGKNIGYYEEGGLLFDPVSLFGHSFKEHQINFLTLHNSGLQDINIIGTNSVQAKITTVNEWISVPGREGSFKIQVPKQDVVVEFDGYLSFTPDSYFLPKRSRIINYRPDISWIKNNCDYIVISSSGYNPPIEDNGWLLQTASWDIDHFNDNKAYIKFLLSRSKDTDRIHSYSLDWIKIDINIPPVWERY